VNTDLAKDSTPDGLYEPRQASGERKTGPTREAKRISDGDEDTERHEPAHQEDQPIRRGKIDDDDVWAKPPE